MMSIGIKTFFIVFVLLLVGCKTTINMKTEKQNGKKAERIFTANFAKNGNAFLYSVGTIGVKYIWTHLNDKELLLTVVNLNGKVEKKQINFKGDWLASTNLSIPKVDCPIIIDGSVLKIKIKNQKGEMLDETLLYEFVCLSDHKEGILGHLLNEMDQIKIR